MALGGPALFVRLKLRLIRNSFRGQTWRTVGWALGVTFGLFVGLVALAGLAGSGLTTRDGGFVTAVLVGSAVVAGWALVPLLFFGIDETLDPARFALLPLRRSTLTRGMFVAAFVGAPAVITLIATSGLVVAAALRFDAAAAIAAAIGIVFGLTLGIAASRALTSAFASLLRSRKVRDLAAVLIAVLASGIGPLQWFLSSAAMEGRLGDALPVAEVLAWTPLGAPYAWPYDVAEGRYGAALARYAIVIVAIGLLLWWWSRTIESAMLAVDSGGAVSSRPVRGGAVATLLSRLVRPSVFGAIMARESRYWWRDVRRRASIISILMASAVLPVVFIMGSGSTSELTLSAFGFSFATSMAGTMGGMLLGNQFGLDGTAYAAHVLVGVPGRVELRARAAAIGVVAAPVQVAVILAVAFITARTGQIPAALGLLGASFGAAVAAAGLLSVLAAYPQPESTNPFATNSGGGSPKGMLAMVAMLATLVFCMPILIAALYLGTSTIGSWAVLGLGLAYGGLTLWLGTVIAGNLLDRRGPEVLAAVTPRR